MDVPVSQNGFDRLFTAGRFCLALGLLIFIFYPGLVLGTQAFCYRDSGLFSYPVAYYLRDAMRHGNFPFWNPYSYCGIPFAAQWNSLALYPFSLLYIAAPMPWALNCFLLGHLLLGGFGMYRLAHRWFGTRFAASVAGLVFGWNGLALHCLMWPCHTAGLAWMPWVVLLCCRACQEGGSRIAWAALAAGCQLLTGSPEIILLTWMIVAAVFALERRGFWVAALRLAATGLLAAALSAAQMLPFIDLVRHGDRSSATGTGLWSLSPWGLANFFVPMFHLSGSLSGVYMQAEQQWTSSYYIGIVPLALAAVALWRARRGPVLLLGALALAGLVLAMGDAVGALNILKRAVPLLGFIRFPVKFIILTVFCLALLAGAGAAWLQTQPLAGVRRSLRLAGILAGLAVLAVMAAEYWFPFPSDVWSVVWPNALARLVFLAGGLVLLALIAKNDSTRAQPWLALGLLVLMGLDICTHEPPQNPSVPASAYADEPPPMTPVPQVGQSRVMLASATYNLMDHLVNPNLLDLYLAQRRELFNDCNLLNGIPKVGGFMPLHLKEESRVETLLGSGTAGPGLAQFLGISQVAVPQPLGDWAAQTNFMPWATIGQKPVFLDDTATLAALAGNEFLPRHIVYLPLDARSQTQAEADPQARILSSHFAPAECVFEASAQSRAMLVVAQAWYHCWRASVDGKAVPLWRANHAFQALEIPPGRHQVRLFYVDEMFRAGGIISLAALAACAGLIFSKRRPIQ